MPESHQIKASNILSAVVFEIQQGSFDNCRSGSEIINKVAADKSVLSEWKN